MKKIALRNTRLTTNGTAIPATPPIVDIDIPGTEREITSAEPPLPLSGRHWLIACKRVLPIYSAVHLALLVTTALSVLFLRPDFKWESSPLSTLWHAWDRWDVGHYTFIATHGYPEWWRTAFFPLYPLLMSALIFLIHNPLVAGMVISNLAGLVMLVVLYQMVREDFDEQTAERAVLYLSLFPTAFFLLAAYNEALFLCLSLLCFYHIRRGQWWLAGLSGLSASLTRSAGVLLLLPFCYEYLRQHRFKLKNIRWNILSAALLPLGLAAFAFYCYLRFGDPLAFSHSQAGWNRALAFPWSGIVRSIKAITTSSGLLSFQAQRNLIDLGTDLLCATLILLSLFGPWRLPRTHWSYLLYAALLWLFFNLVPDSSGSGFYPLQSVSRFVLEVFPAFIILAKLGRHRAIHLHYLLISGAVLFFLATQFLTGHWVI